MTTISTTLSSSGPTTAGSRRRPCNAATFDLAPFGYEEVEYLFEGTVESFRSR